MTEGSSGSTGPADPADAATPAGDGTRSESAAFAERIGERLGRSDLLEDLRDDDGEIRVSRREALAYAGGTGAGLGGWKALHNVVLGYGVVAGTNVREQNAAALTRQNFGVRYGASSVGGNEVRTDGAEIALYQNDEFRTGIALEDDPTAAARIDAEYGLAGQPFTQLHDDLSALAAGEATFSFSKTSGFLDRIAAAEARPFTVEALRGPVYDSPDADFVGEFADVPPTDGAGLIDGIKQGFRQYSYYDVPRYAAGSVEDNILLGAVDLRQYFESPADFEALANGENSGLFCTELVNRSIEGFHSVPAIEQSPPLLAGCVYDQRHKHSYTVLASAIREDGELVVPVTFVDYTHSTLYDDLHLRWLLGDGLEAYNDRHRVTEIFWNSYAAV